jgi:hypothetical protein
MCVLKKKCYKINKKSCKADWKCVTERQRRSWWREQGDQISLSKNRPRFVAHPFLATLIHNLYRGRHVPMIGAAFVIFKKHPKINSRQICSRKFTESGHPGDEWIQRIAIHFEMSNEARLCVSAQIQGCQIFSRHNIPKRCKIYRIVTK